ncbi:MAG: cation:proton antiporter [Bacteroidales bacterium]|nr:cation:proton antiporter [Bacteroidales bacterium]
MIELFAQSSFVDQISVMVVFSLVLIFLLKKIHQPYFLAYILVGILLGKNGLNLVTSERMIFDLGDFGLILLLFFIGAEIDLQVFSKNFKHSFVGVILQIALSFLFMSMVGIYYGWSWKIVLFFSFVISLSSTALVFQFLMQNASLNSPVGILTGGILLVQDVLIVPMLLTLHFISKDSIVLNEFLPTLIGAILIVVFFWLILKYKFFRIPFRHELKSDHELQVLLAFFMCFGFSWLTNLMGLSAALGAFIAGILVSKDRCNVYLKQALIPFRVFFLSFFFLSIGMRMDLPFLFNNFQLVALITLAIFVVNSLINAVVFKIRRFSWAESFYAGALLSQIGEFSFVLAQVASVLGLINDFLFQILISTITMTMVLTTPWIAFVQAMYSKTMPEKLRLFSTEITKRLRW